MRKLGLVLASLLLMLVAGLLAYTYASFNSTEFAGRDRGLRRARAVLPVRQDAGLRSSRLLVRAVRRLLPPLLGSGPLLSSLALALLSRDTSRPPIGGLFREGLGRVQESPFPFRIIFLAMPSATMRSDTGMNGLLFHPGREMEGLLLPGSQRVTGWAAISRSSRAASSSRVSPINTLLLAFCMRLGRVPFTKLIKLSPDVEGWMQSARAKCRNDDPSMCAGLFYPIRARSRSTHRTARSSATVLPLFRGLA